MSREPNNLLKETADGLDRQAVQLQQEAQSEADPKTKRDKISLANSYASQATVLRAMADGKGSEGDLGLNILKMFFEAFLGKEFTSFIFDNDPEAPNESPEDLVAEPLADRVRNAQSAVNATRAWESFRTERGASAPAGGVRHINPVGGATEVTSGFGPRNLSYAPASKNHKGYDFGARGGDRSPDIVATADGVVMFAARRGGYGNTVIIRHQDGTETLYGHMTGRQMPQVGQRVAQGEVIGELGSTGNSTAPHLHYEQRVNGVQVRPRINGELLAVGDDLTGHRHAANDHHDDEEHVAAAPQRAPQQQARAAATPARVAGVRTAAAPARPSVPAAKAEPDDLGDHIKSAARSAMATATDLGDTVKTGFSTAGRLFGRVTENLIGRA